MRIASVGGRYYAMDRDKRWDRVRLAWDAIVEVPGKSRPDPTPRIEHPVTGKLVPDPKVRLPYHDTAVRFVEPASPVMRCSTAIYGGLLPHTI